MAPTHTEKDGLHPQPVYPYAAEHLLRMHGFVLHNHGDDNLTSDEIQRLKQICVLVINVERSQKRLELIREQLRPLGLDTFVFKAVDAAELIKHDVGPELSIIQYKDLNFMVDYTRRFDFPSRGTMPIGMVACSLSHLLIYSMIASGQLQHHKHFLILEDDATVIQPPHVVRKTLANIPDERGYDMLYLNSESKWEPIAINKAVNDHYSTIEYKHFNASVSYMLSHTGASKLLAYSTHCVSRPPDDLISNLYMMGGYEVLAPTHGFLFGNNYDLESDCNRFSVV